MVNKDVNIMQQQKCVVFEITERQRCSVWPFNVYYCWLLVV